MFLRLTQEELDFLSPEHQAIARELPQFEQGQLRALIASQKAELAKLAAQAEKERALVRQYAVENRVREALAKGGAGRNAELLVPHLAPRVRAEAKDGEFAFAVVDQEGKPRLRDGRPMTVDELINEARRLPDMEKLFTKNGRHA